MKYQSKWKVIGTDREDFKKIYEKNRMKAYTILKNRHKKEYSIILNLLMNQEYKRRCVKEKVK